MLLEGQTAHARYHPVRHSFQYPVLYGNCWLTSKDPPNYVHSLCAGGALSIHQNDYLPPSTTVLTGTNLHSRLRNLLLSYPVYSRLIQPQSRVLLLTMPRWLGYSFNPVSVLYVYSEDGSEWKLTVLLVNNTFGETYPYILPVPQAKPSSRKGYTHQWSVERRFHVSPFNDRLGRYEVHLNDPMTCGNRHNFLVIHYWPLASEPLEDQNGKEVKKLVAGLEVYPCPSGLGYPWTTLLFRYPLTLFLTFPRISYQAFQLAYRKYLRVYPRPMQLMSGTIQQSPADAYGRWCRGKLLQCFKNVSVTSGNRFVIDYRPARTHWPITVDGSGGGGGDADADADNESAMTYYLTVISDEVWPWFHLLPSVRGALEFCVAMGYMELRAASDRSTDTDQQAVIAKLSALFEVEESFGGALLPRALVAMRKFVFHGESRGNFIDRQCSLTETFYGLLLLVFSLTISLLMDLITRWHAGYEPAFWSQWRRYRLLTKSK